MRPKVMKSIIGGIIGAIVGMIIGFFKGMDVGGNDYPNLVFNGGRGYEAVGQIGAIIGCFLGAIGGFLLVLIIIGLIGNGKSK